MGMMLPEPGKSQPFDFQAQRAALENSEMSAGVLPVFPAQGPTDPLRPIPGNRKSQNPVRLEDPPYLAQSAVIVGQMFQDLGTDHTDKGGIGKRQGQAVAAEHQPGVSAMIAVPGKDLKTLLRIPGRIEIEIQAPDPHRIVAVQSVGMPPPAAAEIQDIGSRKKFELFEINCLHGCGQGPLYRPVLFFRRFVSRKNAVPYAGDLCSPVPAAAADR